MKRPGQQTREVLVRTTAGTQAGFGHLRRCLSLAQALHRLGAHVSFLLDGDPIGIEEVVRAGFEGSSTDDAKGAPEVARRCRQQRIDALVVDSYAWSEEDFALLCGHPVTVVALDDLADRGLPVNLVVNGSSGARNLAYPSSAGSRYLLGPQYALLRPEFAEPVRRQIRESVGRVLITLGGSDPHDLTPKLARWATDALSGVATDVVIGPFFGDLFAREPICERPSNVVVHRCPAGVRALMLEADLALSGGGQTTYELAATATPTIAVRLAQNQTVNLSNLSAGGTLCWAGDVMDADLEAEVKGAIAALAGNAGRRASMSERGRAVVDGGGAARVAGEILDLVGGRAR